MNRNADFETVRDIKEKLALLYKVQKKYHSLAYFFEICLIASYWIYSLAVMTTKGSINWDLRLPSLLRIIL